MSTALEIVYAVIILVCFSAEQCSEPEGGISKRSQCPKSWTAMSLACLC
jgi:hypothetical protein